MNSLPSLPKMRLFSAFILFLFILSYFCQLRYMSLYKHRNILFFTFLRVLTPFLLYSKSRLYKFRFLCYNMINYKLLFIRGSKGEYNEEKTNKLGCCRFTDSRHVYCNNLLYRSISGFRIHRRHHKPVISGFCILVIHMHIKNDF